MSRKENTFIDVFNTQAEVLSKVNELKAQGYNESDMYVVAQDKDSFSMLKDQTDVHVDTTGEEQHQGFMGKFMAAFSEDSSAGAFSGMGLDRTESEEYRRQVQNGKLVLYVDSEYGDSYEKHNQSYGVASDMNGDQGYGTTSGVDRNQDYDNSSKTDRTSSIAPDAGTEEERLRLHEERLNVDKERVQTGEVNVSKRVVEDQQSIEVPVEREEVYVERRPVNESETRTDAFVDENDSIHVPLSEERVVVSKQDVVTEEIVVGKRKVQDTETVSETVRREEADINDGTNMTNDLNRDNDRDNRLDRDNDLDRDERR
ncbi:conserved hypothetical protein [Exiguobacterium sibiricum 255-15]|uniref:YsnF/AvaK domain-containing protein n=1 Tax=Exiguobacterium sibiricum (strain DSM 17290 / CCUG 55495 / CIP 109462 / JCM 13490 / 255-15) TaxID=262543 RepID=B1YIZ3_EXIS2|nr:YsnF/AvaK domain-containing protein [Exiguobacterium sibiricum]ACB59923.1 conserved hypothetical protein [Exiguobacterium sibiricum 255-15]